MNKPMKWFVGGAALLGFAVLAMIGGPVISGALAIGTLMTIGFFIILMKNDMVKNLALKHQLTTDLLVSIGAALICGTATVTGAIR